MCLVLMVLGITFEKMQVLDAQNPILNGKARGGGEGGRFFIHCLATYNFAYEKEAANPLTLCRGSNHVPLQLIMTPG